MQKTNDKSNIRSTATHLSVQKSTTLNRRYVKRPGPVKISVDSEEDEKIIVSENLEDAIQEAKNIAPKKHTISHFAESKSDEEDSIVEKPADKKVVSKISVESVDERVAEKAAEIEEELKRASEELKQIEERDAKAKKLTISEATSEPLDERVVEKPAEIEIEDTPEALTKEADLPPEPNPYQPILDAREAALEVKKVAGRKAEFYAGPTLKERKDAEIAKAIAEVSVPTPAATTRLSRSEKRASKRAEKTLARARKSSARAERLSKKPEISMPSLLEKQIEEPKKLTLPKASRKRHTSRFVLALGCSLACVTVLGIAVYHMIPDIPVKVTAMQSGIEAKYPSYIPRDFALSGVYINDSEEVVMDFTGPESATYSIAESDSSWDSAALLNNYVKRKWGVDDYAAVREGGITIYIHNSDAVWVNGGMLYRIEAKSGTLTKKQIKNIAISI